MFTELELLSSYIPISQSLSRLVSLRDGSTGMRTSSTSPQGITSAARFAWFSTMNSSLFCPLDLSTALNASSMTCSGCSNLSSSSSGIGMVITTVNSQSWFKSLSFRIAAAHSGLLKLPFSRPAKFSFSLELKQSWFSSL